MECPNCNGQSFKQNLYEGIKLDLCQRCFGYWLDQGELEKIISDREKFFSKEEISKVSSGRKPGLLNSSNKQKKCPKCSQDMQILNYGYDSGVMIDRCSANHGIWLDAGELENIQIFREELEKSALKESQKWAPILKNTQKNTIQQNEKISLFVLLVKLFERLGK